MSNFYLNHEAMDYSYTHIHIRASICALIHIHVYTRIPRAEVQPYTQIYIHVKCQQVSATSGTITAIVKCQQMVCGAGMLVLADWRVWDSSYLICGTGMLCLATEYIHRLSSCRTVDQRRGL